MRLDGVSVRFFYGEVHHLMEFQTKDDPLKQPYRRSSQQGISISAQIINWACQARHLLLAPYVP